MLIVALAVASIGGASVECSDRMERYVEYCTVFKHYKALETWKWHNILMDDMMDDRDLPDFWEDFLLDFFDDSEKLVKTITTLRQFLDAGVQPALATSLMCAMEDENKIEAFTY